MRETANEERDIGMYETAFEIPGESFEFPGEAEQSTEWESGETYESEAEALEAELVQELFEITTEAELDQFLGKLASTVMKGASKFVKSPIGKALGGVLKNVAKTALPAVGGALGSLVLPGAGTAIGAKLGSMAGGLLEAQEAESMGEVEAEWEAASRYVRFARGAFANAARAPRNVPTRAAVRAASISSARRYAPSLLGGSDRRSSQWRSRRRGYGGGRYRQSWQYAEPAPWYGGGDDYAGGGYEPDQWWQGDDYESEGEGEGEAPGRPGGGGGSRAASGRWVRRGGKIVLLGV
ncbi:hypothetical protein [Kribbella sp. CA-247076]|uniref:hypothetical protein n=1 Tax=Kribbella sp. CA-247076 TaxID=3239941 RepID=UPI003D90F55B